MNLDNTQTADRYRSLEEMRSAHHALLKRKRTEQIDDLHNDIQRLMEVGCATGAVLDKNDDRAMAQSMLDYWSTVAMGPGTDSLQTGSFQADLMPFTPELEGDLQDADFPYGKVAGINHLQDMLRPAWVRLTAECLSKLERSNLVAVTGGTGSGRSTLLCESVLPAIREGRLRDGQWRPISVESLRGRPTRQLLAAIRPAADEKWIDRHAQAMEQDPSHLTRLLDDEIDGSAVLVFNRFEDVFTDCEVPHDLKVLADNLFGVIKESAKGHVVILVLRNDYVGYLNRLDALELDLDQNQVVVTFTTPELRSAIETPAKRIGLHFEEGLAERLLMDFQGDPASLSLLLFTLRRLWEQRSGRWITWEAYRKVGGGGVALERCAESLYLALPEAKKAVVKALFLKLLRQEAGSRVTSCKAGRAELRTVGDADVVDIVLDQLLAAQLLQVKDDDVIRVSADAIARYWPRLVEWLEVERVSKRRVDDLSNAAGQWHSAGKNVSFLWKGMQLQEAVGLAEQEQLGPVELDFIAASKRVAKIRQVQKWGSLALVVVMLFAVIIIWAVVSDQGKRTAELHRDWEEARGASHKAQVDVLVLAPDIEQAQHDYDLASQHRDEHAARHDAARAALWDNDAAKLRRQIRQKLNDGLVRAKTSEEKRKNAARLLAEHPTLGLGEDSENGSVDEAEVVKTIGEYEAQFQQLLDAMPNASTSERGLLDHVAAISVRQMPRLKGLKEFAGIKSDQDKGVALLSPDGRWLATAIAFDPKAETPTKVKVHVWDRTRLNEVADTSTEFGFCTVASSDQMAWNRNSDQFAVADGKDVKVWTITRDELDEVLLPQPGQVGHIRFAGNARTPRLAVVTEKDGKPDELIVWDLSKSEILTKTAINAITASHLTVSSNGAVIALSTSGRSRARGEVLLFDANTGALSRALSVSHDVNHVAISADSRLLVTSGADSQANVWMLGSSNASLELPHDGQVTAATFSPDGNHILTTSHDGKARLWPMWKDERGNLLPSRPIHAWEHPNWVLEGAFSADGRFIVTRCRDKAVRVFDAGEGQLAFPILHHDTGATGIWISPDCRDLITTSKHLIRDWSLASANQPARSFVDAHSAHSQASGLFNSDGSRLVTIGGEDANVAVVMDTRTGERTSAPMVHQDRILYSAFSPNNKLVVTASADNTARVWDAETGAPFKPPMMHGSEVRLAQFDASSKLIATVSASAKPNVNSLHVWKLAELTANVPKEPLKLEHDFMVQHVAFSSDGQWLAAIGRGAVKIWSVADGALAGNDSPESTETYAAFAQASNVLATCGTDDKVRIWKLDGGSWKKVSCDLKGHGADVVHVAISHDGRWVVSSSSDNTARIWNTETGENTGTLRHDGHVNAASFSPQHAFIVTACADGTARIWERQSGSQLAVLRLGGNVREARFDDSMNRVLTAGYVKTGSYGAGCLRFRPWDISATKSSSDELAKLTRLLASSSIDEKSLAALLPKEHLNLWGELSEYRATDETAKASTSLEIARDCMATEQWFSTIWHSSRLLNPLGGADTKELVETLQNAGIDLLELPRHLAEMHVMRARARIRLGRARHNTELLRDAVADYKLALFSQPNMALAVTELAKLHQELGEHDQAVQRYQQAIKLVAPPDWRLHRALGRGQLAVKRFANAVTAFNDALHLITNSIQDVAYKKSLQRILRGDIASVHIAESKWDKAVEQYEKALELDPPTLERQRLLEQLTATFIRQGAWDHALSSHAKTLDGQPGSDLLWLRLAVLKLAANDTEGYVKVCEEMLERFGSTNEASIANNVAWACSLGPTNTKLAKQAVALAERARKLRLNDAMTLNTLGAALYRSGDNTTAIEKLESSRRVDLASRRSTRDQPMRQQSIQPMDEMESLPDEAGTEWDWLFLAMAHQKSDEPDKLVKARKWLQQVETRRELVHSRTSDDDLWLRIEFDILLKEARSLIPVSSDE